ncbi:hypothetical protein MMC16_007302 [Acarospora aff. strigata]|nr:hypothetical protein [Acarospora aff. strigata]
MAPPTRPHRLLGISLKMYYDISQTQAFIEGVRDLSAHAAEHDIDIFVIPDFLNITAASRILEGTNVMLGAQDAFWEDRGAYTGAISPAVLKQAGCQIVEIGHAERRGIFGETDGQVALKAKAAVRNGLTPLVCVGEKARSPVASEAVGLALRECIPQVMSVLAAVPADVEVILAYEPLWAIDRSESASPDHVVAVTQQLRNLTATRKGLTRILYGGRAESGAFQMLKEGVDGLFLDSIVHDPDTLRNIITELGQA